MGQPNPTGYIGDMRSVVVSDILGHSGVKGMHWGVRKDHAQAVNEGVNIARKHAPLIDRAGKLARSKPKQSETKKAFAAKIEKVGGVHKLSDKQLKGINERLNMEKKYSEIVNADAKARSEHRMAVAKLLIDVGKIAVPLVVAGFAAKAAKDTFSNPGVYRTKAYTHGPKALGSVIKVING